MIDIERLAVNKVSDLIGKCARLADNIPVNDKTPIVDGGILLYSSDKHTKATLVGDVAVQVKGRTSKKKPKAKRNKASFSVEREALQYFKENRGGIYFLVTMDDSGNGREVFYVTLSPFLASRYLSSMTERQKKKSISMKRLPEEADKIEKILQLAYEARTQGAHGGDNSKIIESAIGFSIKTIEPLSPDEPTELSLKRHEYVVFAEMATGMSIPVDMDLTIYPESYVGRRVHDPVICGRAVFDGFDLKQLSKNEYEMRLSDGLLIRVKRIGGAFKARVEFTSAGGPRAQLRDAQFLWASITQEPLTIGKNTQTPGFGKLTGDAQKVKRRVEQLEKISELLDYFGISDAEIPELKLDSKTADDLLILHDALVCKNEIEATVDGAGRYDFPIGPYFVSAMVVPGAEDGWLKIVDPFNPDCRGEFILIFRDAEGEAENVTSKATPYETLSVDSIISTINIRLDKIINAYSSLEDRESACRWANQMVLNLFQAYDRASGDSKGERFLVAAERLTNWLISHGDEQAAYRVNAWQAKARLGSLTEDDRKEMRLARRAAAAPGGSRLEEACLLILLGDFEEVEIVLQELSNEDSEALRSWPIWTLSTIGAARTQEAQTIQARLPLEA